MLGGVFFLKRASTINRQGNFGDNIISESVSPNFSRACGSAD
jgi:hypothetical protein